MKKILINEMTLESEKFINHNRSGGVNGARELLALYHKNKLPEIISTSELRKFLDDPFGYYKDRADTHVKKTFPDEALSFDAVQELFSFSFKGWDTYHTDKVKNMIPYMGLDSNGLVILTRGWEQKLRDSFKIYSEDPEVIEVVGKMRDMAKTIIEIHSVIKEQTHFKPDAILGRFGIYSDGFSINPKMINRILQNLSNIRLVDSTSRNN